jgi:hypothetical protein
MLQRKSTYIMTTKNGIPIVMGGSSGLFSAASVFILARNVGLLQGSTPRTVLRSASLIA